MNRARKMLVNLMLLIYWMKTWSFKYHKDIYKSFIRV